MYHVYTACQHSLSDLNSRREKNECWTTTSSEGRVTSEVFLRQDATRRGARGDGSGREIRRDSEPVDPECIAKASAEGTQAEVRVESVAKSPGVRKKAFFFSSEEKSEGAFFFRGVNNEIWTSNKLGQFQKSASPLSQ